MGVGVSGEVQTDSVLKRLKAYWPFAVGLGGALVWIVTSLITASLSLAAIQSDVSTNKEEITEISSEMKDQDKSSTQLNERMIKVESEVNHIKVHQTENHRDIKDQLTIMQQDIKKMSR